MRFGSPSSEIPTGLTPKPTRASTNESSREITLGEENKLKDIVKKSIKQSDLMQAPLILKLENDKRFWSFFVFELHRE